MYEQIRYEVADPVATITLNRPQALNAWTTRMGAEVKHAMAAAEADPAVVGERACQLLEVVDVRRGVVGGG